jgi:hypothetical protein
MPGYWSFLLCVDSKQDKKRTEQGRGADKLYRTDIAQALSFDTYYGTKIYTTEKRGDGISSKGNERFFQ